LKSPNALKYGSLAQKKKKSRSWHRKRENLELLHSRKKKLNYRRKDVRRSAKTINSTER